MNAERIRSLARVLSAWAPALLLAAGLAGCYTMLRHPASTDAAEGGRSEECLACHDADESLAIESYPWVEYYSTSASPWINYYGAPWWHDVRWERCETCDGTETSEDPDFVLSGRNGWGRRVRQQAFATPAAERARDDAFAPLPVVSPPSVAPATVARPVTPPAETPATEEPEPEKPQPPRQRGIRR